MADFNFHAVNAGKPLSYTFSKIYRPVLTSRTAESHQQMFAPIRQILIN
jgi:hypothetical protein